MPSNDTYEKRFVAFVDILGFGDWVKRADANPALRGQIADSLRRAKEVEAPSKGTTTGLAFHFFSDSIIASAEFSVGGLWHLLFSMDALAWNLIQQDVWVRGGVAVGGVFVDPEIVFGTGINEAYRLESVVSKNPRIILSRPVMEKVVAFAETENWTMEIAQSRILRDSDGVYFLNFLNDVAAANAESAKLEESRERPWVIIGSRVRGLIQARVDSTIDSPDIYAKAKWMADYWNRVVVRDRSEEKLPMGRVRLASDYGTPRPLPFRPTFTSSEKH